MTEAGTEPGRRSRLGRWSVRTRLTVAMALLAATALCGAGVVVWRLESARLQEEVAAHIDQEIAEFRQMREGKDPDTAQGFRSAGRLLEVFLSRNVSSDDELLLAYAGGARPLTTVGSGDRRLALLSDQEYRRALDDLRDEGGSRVVDTASFGEVWLTVVDVRVRGTQGSLAIASFIDREQARLDRTMRTYVIVAATALALITLVAASQAGRLLRPVRTLRDTAREITATDLSRRIPVSGHDDLTELTHTINDMLDRLEAGFTAQRDFLDDAGHELRTPLTVLRGHLEVLEHGDPDDVAQTRTLLLDETDRMSRLVEDLVLLAKSRRPGFVRPRPVDVGPLTRALLAKAGGLGERDWQLDEGGDSATTVPMDEQRVTQAVLQLADNAVKHTSPGDRIGIGSATDGHDLRIWVRDTGDGVAPEHRRRIFERFGRAGTRAGDDGVGLGLSIVDAIVDAHGGSVAVLDTRGGGATFVITLPMEGTPWHAS